MIALKQELLLWRGVVLDCLIARSNLGDSRNLRRPDTPEYRTFSAPADVTGED
jgi:hypothetical protein